MWLEVLFQETLVREKMAEARRDAALQTLLRNAEPARRPCRSWTAIRQFGRTALAPRLKRLVERVAHS